MEFGTFGRNECTCSLGLFWVSSVSSREHIEIMLRVGGLLCIAILRAVGCVLAAVSHMYGARRSTIHEDLLKGDTHWYLFCA